MKYEILLADDDASIRLVLSKALTRAGHTVKATDNAETLLKWFKIQGIEIQQGIYQRRKELCNLVFYTAAGTVKIPYIELKKAKRMKNFILFKIENSEKPWM